MTTSKNEGDSAQHPKRKSNRSKYADQLRKAGLKYGELFNPHRKFDGLYMPDGIAAEPKDKLDAEAKLVLAALLRFAGANGKCHPKFCHIADLTGLTVRMVAHRLSVLVEMGLIKKSKRPRRSSYRYYFTWHPLYEQSLIGRKDDKAKTKQQLDPVRVVEETENVADDNGNTDSFDEVTQRALALLDVDDVPKVNEPSFDDDSISDTDRERLDLEAATIYETMLVTGSPYMEQEIDGVIRGELPASATLKKAQ